MALPSWSNTLCRGNLLQEVLEGSLEPSAETSGHSGTLRVPETIRVTRRGRGWGTLGKGWAGADCIFQVGLIGSKQASLFQAPDSTSLMICPPYGERMIVEATFILPLLYGKVGFLFRVFCPPLSPQSSLALPIPKGSRRTSSSFSPACLLLPKLTLFLHPECFWSARGLMK